MSRIKDFLARIATWLGLGQKKPAAPAPWLRQERKTPGAPAAAPAQVTPRGGVAAAPATGRHFKALLVGINKYEQAPLRGCVNDVTMLQGLLKETFGLTDANTRLLLDEAATRAAIEDGLRWLAQSDGSPGTQVRLFHFSGHGVQVPDQNGDEPDGADEALAQYDYKTAGVLTDDVLQGLYGQFPPDTHLLLTMDCCHSGTIHLAPTTEDIVERYLMPSQAELDQIDAARRAFEERQFERRQTIERQLEAENVPVAEREGRIASELATTSQKRGFGAQGSNDLVVLLSAARADQTAADARFEVGYHGALSYYLAQTLRQHGPGLTYAALHEHVRQAIADARLPQAPQLECSAANRTRTILSSGGTATRAAPLTPPTAPAATVAPQPSAPSSDDDTRDLPPEFFDGLLTLADADDEGDTPRDRGNFLFIGKGLKAAEFTDYVNSYDFGSMPPSFVVIHHTYIPDTLHARAKNATWDSGEDGMSEAQIYQKRLRQLTGIKNYYQNQLGWTRGPHLFIDERWVWLFTPMYYQGIHAAAGNGNGRGVYSIGIEVVGHYAHVRWPAPIEELVGHSVAVIKQRLNTFEIKHQPMAGGVSGHRDYNKPACPGDAITNDYYIGVLQRAWDRLQSGGAPAAAAAPPPPPPAEPLPEDPPLLGAATGGQEHAVAYIKVRLPGDSEYTNDVELIMSYYWTYAPPVGVDPFLAACQCIFETDSLRSDWAARPRRNPAGLGVRQEGGRSFASWEDGVQAHIGQLLAFALTDEEANDAQKQMMAKNPRHKNVPAEHRGQVKTIAGFNNRWTRDANYATGLLNRMKDVRGD